MRYSLDPGRTILRDGKPIVIVQRATRCDYAELSPAEADTFAHAIVAALNARDGGLLPGGMLPVYLRREPTTDALTRASYEGRKPFDVVAYGDMTPDGPTSVKGRWHWDRKSKPRPGCKTITLNCWRWRAIWLPDVVEDANAHAG